ncbi:MAG: BrnT family toxin [Ignavibacteria bacterium]|nr:BrnT family toxin [Ignavibacteria bacterium]
MINFIWDKNKAKLNHEKHKLSFEEAVTVFADPLAFIFDDDEHSRIEKRLLIIGHTNKNKIIIVSFTERNQHIRIISARKVTTKEKQDYEENS